MGKTIIVPIDLSDATNTILEHAVNLASSISTTSNVSVYDYTGTNLLAGIGPNYVLTANPFFLNSNTISANVSIPSGYNALAAGPLTQAANVQVIVPAGSRFIIL